jgi:hypothetical protein
MFHKFLLSKDIFSQKSDMSLKKAGITSPLVNENAIMNHEKLT